MKGIKKQPNFWEKLKTAVARVETVIIREEGIIMEPVWGAIQRNVVWGEIKQY